MEKLLKCLLPIVLLCLSVTGKAQELVVELTNNKEYALNDTMFISITFKNIEKESYLYLKPEVENVKFGLMVIILTSQKNKKEYVYFLEDGGDIDEISLTCENSVLLGTQEAFTNNIPVLLNEFSPVLDNLSSYNLRILVDYSMVDFKVDKCQTKNIFKNKLKGEIKEIRLK